MNVKSSYHFSGYTLDLHRRSLSYEGQDLPLGPKEFLALSLLVEAAGQAVTREALIEALWPDTIVGDTSLAKNISALRRHLGVNAIEVIPKFGYRFALSVKVGLPVALDTQNRGVSGLPDPPDSLNQGCDLLEVTYPATTPMSRNVLQSQLICDEHFVLTSSPQEPSLNRKKHQFSTWELVLGSTFLLTTGFLAQRTLLARAAPSSDKSLTWPDPQTGLTWAKQDNGTNVTRQMAINYCESTTLDGHYDWRLPKADELQTPYDTSVSRPGLWESTRPVYWHVKGNLGLTGDESASDLAAEGGKEQSFDFSFGRRNYNQVDFSAGHRALCVRPSSK